jgi:predicted nucleotidyltransferase component of viral defense system
MPLYNKAEMSEQAQRYGFLRDTFEKVYRLIKILSYFQSNGLIQKHLVLKGGTAINLTIFEMPRLSVDIDLDYMPNDSKEETQKIRKDISLAIRDYMTDEGYRLSEQSRFSHSLDAFHYLYQNSSGNTDMIKIELNYSLMAHLFESMQREILTNAFGDSIKIQTLDPIGIFAAKANALLTRATSRDLYDFCNMISGNLFADNEDVFRKTIPESVWQSMKC